MPALLDRLYTDRQELADNAEAILKAAEAAPEGLTDDQRTRLVDMRAKAEALDAQIADVEAVNASSNKLKAMISDRQARDEAQEREHSRRGGVNVATGPEVRSWGRKVIESPEFNAYQGTGTSARIAVPGFLESRAAIDTGDLNIPPFYAANVVANDPLTPLLSAIGRVRTSSGTVEYLSWPNASVATVVAEGEVKPEATIGPTPTPLSLSTYAHWKAITRQALEDLPQVRSIVENKLRLGLMAALEAAAGTAITGATLATSGTATDALSASIRIAIGEVQARGYTPTTVLLNPADFSALDVATASPLNPVAAPVSYWGLRPVASASVTAGTAYVGDFTTGATWFDRGDESVYLSDSHADYFIRNLLVILAEVRAAFAVTEPGALQKALGVPVPTEPVVPLTAKAK